MAYRISFNYVAASDNRIHITKMNEDVILCGCVPMSHHKIFTFGEIRRSTFCTKCRKLYNGRPEEEFAIIK